MATLQLLDSPDDKTLGGILITYPSGASKALSWRSEQPIRDVQAMAKGLAARALQDRLDSRAVDDAERTNWVSVVAAMGALVREWNARLEGQHASFDLVDPPGGGGEAR